MERDRDRERDPTKTLQERLGYKIVHLVKTDTGAATITNETKKIRLNPISFPFNGRCRIFLHSIVLGSKAIPFAGADFINLSLNVSQPFSQSNIPFSATDLIAKSNSIIFTFDTDVVVANSLQDSYIDAVLTPNSVIELNLINENGSLCSLTTNDTGYVVHLYVKSKN